MSRHSTFVSIPCTLGIAALTIAATVGHAAADEPATSIADLTFEPADPRMVSDWDEDTRTWTLEPAGGLNDVDYTRVVIAPWRHSATDLDGVAHELADAPLADTLVVPAEGEWWTVEGFALEGPDDGRSGWVVLGDRGHDHAVDSACEKRGPVLHARVDGLDALCVVETHDVLPIDHAIVYAEALALCLQRELNRSERQDLDAALERWAGARDARHDRQSEEARAISEEAGVMRAMDAFGEASEGTMLKRDVGSIENKTATEHPQSFEEMMGGGGVFDGADVGSVLDANADLMRRPAGSRADSSERVPTAGGNAEGTIGGLAGPTRDRSDRDRGTGVAADSDDGDATTDDDDTDESDE